MGPGRATQGKEGGWFWGKSRAESASSYMLFEVSHACSWVVDKASRFSFKAAFSKRFCT